MASFYQASSVSRAAVTTAAPPAGQCERKRSNGPSGILAFGLAAVMILAAGVSAWFIVRPVLPSGAKEADEPPVEARLTLKADSPFWLPAGGEKTFALAVHP